MIYQFDVVYDFFMMNVSLALYINYMICCMVYVFIQGNHISRDAGNPNIPQSKQVCNMHFFAYGFPRDRKVKFGSSIIQHRFRKQCGISS